MKWLKVLCPSKYTCDIYCYIGLYVHKQLSVSFIEQAALVDYKYFDSNGIDGRRNM